MPCWLSDNAKEMKTGMEYSVGDKPLTVKEIPENLRPRELVQRVGVKNAGEDMLLAVLLRSGIKGRNVVDLSRVLLQKYGGLSGMAEASVEELSGIKGMGPVRAQVLAVSLELARRLALDKTSAQKRIKTPLDVVNILRDKVWGLDREMFWALPLDTKNKLKGLPVEVTAGLLDASLVHPREVFREAIRTASASVILAHNHPSGDCTPSSEDIKVTRQLVEAGRIVDIKVLDHVILSGVKIGDDSGFVSMREAGLVSFS